MEFKANLWALEKKKKRKDLCVCEYMLLVYGCPQWPEEGIPSPDARATDKVIWDVGAGN